MICYVSLAIFGFAGKNLFTKYIYIYIYIYIYNKSVFVHKSILPNKHSKSLIYPLILPPRKNIAACMG